MRLHFLKSLSVLEGWQQPRLVRLSLAMHCRRFAPGAVIAQQVRVRLRLAAATANTAVRRTCSGCRVRPPRRCL